MTDDGTAASGGTVTSSGAVTGARIAMWSGPRTISTALMRSWGSRADTVVIDEPLYGYYLQRTGAPHPGRDEVITTMKNEWREVIDDLTRAPFPAGKSVFYAKHMTHHLLPEVDRGALGGLRHAYLIRDPRQLLASYAKVRAEPVLEDLGLVQQVEIFRMFGGPVVDSADILQRPEPALRALCAALGVPFDPAMLSWPSGPRDTDGIWARHWYDQVWRSTSFGPYRERAAELPPELRGLAERCLPYYEEMSAHRIRP